MRTAIFSVLALLLSIVSAHAETPAEFESKGIAALKLAQTESDAVVSAAIFFGQAAESFEKAGNEEKATEMNSFLYWCKKKMTLQQMDAFLKGDTALAAMTAKRMQNLEKSVPPPDESQKFVARAEAYAKAHPDEHLLIAIRFFEIADRFKGSDASLQAQDRSLKEMTLAGQNAAPATKWTPLFNGKDLAGWDGDRSIWRIENNEIVGRTPRIEQNSFLIHKTPVTNFLLRAEWKMTKAGSFPNSGIQFRCKIADPEKFTVSGYQMDIGDGHYGDLHEELGRSLLKAPSPEAVRSIKPDDWNRYEIQANGPRIKFSINGIPAVDWEERDPKRFVRGGLIALQYHFPGENFVIRYRSIEVSALPSPAEPDLTVFPAGAKAVNLLPLINPAQNAIAGTWSMKKGALVCDFAEGAKLEIPYKAPTEYDYRIEFSRADANETVIQLFSHGGKSIAWAVGAFKNTGCTFLPTPYGAGIKPLDNGKWLFAKRRHVALVQVRANSVKGYLDGNLIVESAYDKLGDKNWSTRNPAFLGVAHKGNVTYYAIELLPGGAP